MSKLKLINDRDEFRALALELGVRGDWHEPDEQEVEAKVFGTSFDNAGFWGRTGTAYALHDEEIHVVFYREGVPVAAVNLATLCSWASAQVYSPPMAGASDFYEEVTERVTITGRL